MNVEVWEGKKGSVEENGVIEIGVEIELKKGLGWRKKIGKSDGINEEREKERRKMVIMKEEKEDSIGIFKRREEVNKKGEKGKKEIGDGEVGLKENWELKELKVERCISVGIEEVKSIEVDGWRSMIDGDGIKRE